LSLASDTYNSASDTPLLQAQEKPAMLTTEAPF
jgi:hypothetical protein